MVGERGSVPPRPAIVRMRVVFGKRLFGLLGFGLWEMRDGCWMICIEEKRRIWRGYVQVYIHKALGGVASPEVVPTFVNKAPPSP